VAHSLFVESLVCALSGAFVGGRQGAGRWFGVGVLHLEVPPPDFVDRRVDDEFEDERGKDAANHWRGDSLPHVRPRAGGPHNSDTSRNHNYHFALWRRFLLVLKSRCRLIEREGPIDSELQGILIDPS
jgi:hypothetical protein